MNRKSLVKKKDPNRIKWKLAAFLLLLFILLFILIDLIEKVRDVKTDIGMMEKEEHKQLKEIIEDNNYSVIILRNTETNDRVLISQERFNGYS